MKILLVKHNIREIDIIFENGIMAFTVPYFNGIWLGYFIEPIYEPIDGYFDFHIENGHFWEEINCYPNLSSVTIEIILEIVRYFGYDESSCEFIEILYPDINSHELDRKIAIEVNLYLFGYRNFDFILGVNNFILGNLKYKVISLFSGIGGFELFFKKYGLSTVWANENNPYACTTYKLHFPRTKLIQKDIRLVDKKDFPEDIDVIIGGYPCQGYSELGAQCLTDERNFLYREFKRCLHYVQPKIFCAENVRGLKKMANGKVLNCMIKEFAEENYRVYYRLLDAKDFGVPQTRTRLIIFGIREDLELEIYYPNPTHGYNLIPYQTVRHAIWHLRDNPGEYYRGDAIRPFLENGYSNDFKKRQRKLSWDRPSAPIIATMWNIPLHPEGKLMKPVEFNEKGEVIKFEFDGEINRTLSVRECLALQSFPENYHLFGNIIDKYRQVGNAVPPLLGEKIAISIREALDGVRHEYCDHWCEDEKKKVKRIRFIDKNKDLRKINLCEDCANKDFGIKWKDISINHIIYPR